CLLAITNTFRIIWQKQARASLMQVIMVPEIRNLYLSFSSQILQDGISTEAIPIPISCFMRCVVFRILNTLTRLPAAGDKEIQCRSRWLSNGWKTSQTM